MIAILLTIDFALGIYLWIVIAAVIFSWLFAFNVVNASNQFVGMIGQFLHLATEPVMGPIRRFMPNLGTIDISPIIVLILIYFLRTLIRTSLIPMVASL